MAFSFGTPAGASAPTFSFGGTSTPAFGASSASLPKTSSTPLFSTPTPSAAPSSTPLFGAAQAAAPTSAPAFNFSTPTQPSQPSMFGAPAPAASAPAFSFSSPFGAPPQPTPGAFGQPQQQQQLAQPGFPGAAQGAGAPAPDDSAVKELQSIQDSYVAAPSNHRFRFQYLFLNVVENPAARVKPADVDELQWREALRRAGGPHNPDNLWPVQALGFKALLERKAAQDDAIKEHAARLEALQQSVMSLSARHDAVLQAQLEGVRKRHMALCQKLLSIFRHIDALEGRFAHAMGYRSASARVTLQKLSAQLAAIEAAAAPGSAGGLQGKVDALVAATRLRAGAAGGPGLADLEAAVDPASLNNAFAILSTYSEALKKMQDVLKRDQRDVAVLEDLTRR